MWSSPSSSLTLEAVCIVIIIIIILLLFIVIVSDVSPSPVERRGFFFSLWRDPGILHLPV